MSAAPAVYGQFGQTLAFAERTLTTILREHLAKRDTQPETWYALQLVATRGPALARAELSSLLEGSPSLDAVSTRELLSPPKPSGVRLRPHHRATEPVQSRRHRDHRPNAPGNHGASG